MKPEKRTEKENKHCLMENQLVVLVVWEINLIIFKHVVAWQQDVTL
jgi:hypothetical protein